VLYGFVYSELRIYLKEQMHMIRHDLHFQKIYAVFVTDFTAQFLETLVNAVHKDFAPVLGTEHHMIFTRIHYIVI
jgi:hypothetical protein